MLMGMVPVLDGPTVSMQDALKSVPIAPPSVASVDIAEALLERRPLTASGIVIIDVESGQRLYSRNAQTKRPMASLAKLMTALIIVENHDLKEYITVPSDIEDVEGTKAYLPPGSRFRVGDLLKALLVSSGNDAAVTLAKYHSGSLKKFAEEMNERARVLGLRHTSFANPIGLDDTGQWSTPQDLAWLAAFVYRQPALKSRLSLPSASITDTAGETISLSQTHLLLQQKDSDVVAGKTGTTDEAGQCLMSVVEMDGREYIVVLLHSEDRYADMKIVLSALSSLTL
jgi:D-alanyl-D-alanine carboxypeptidase